MLYSFKARALLLYLSSALARRGWPRCWRLEEALAEYQRRGGTCEAEYDTARDDPIMVAGVKDLGRGQPLQRLSYKERLRETLREK